MVALLEAALNMYHNRGWFCIPLGLDANNLPKKPLSLQWTTLESSEESLRSLPWDNAKGLGIVLGEQSNNLAVLDLDDEELFNVVLAMQGSSQRMVRTARNRGHLYFTEIDGATQSTWREVEFNGRTIKIELKTTGTQVAAPPTKGYKLLNSSPPMDCYNIQMAFDHLVDCFSDFIPNRVKMSSSQPSLGQAGYPKPWLPQVETGDRNKALFVEAHRLREARMPIEQAIPILKERFNQAYDQGGVDEQEIINTISSAYSKGIPNDDYKELDNERSYFP